MTENEAKFADAIVNYDQRISEVREYIKENFGISSNWDEEESALELYTDNINEGLQLMAAKEYIENTLAPGMVTLNI